MKVAVIGSGVGGLAAAIRLLAAGHDVTVLERRDRPGGRASAFQQDGFTFDAGPTIITAPHLFGELFATMGLRMDEHVRLTALDPFYNVRFEDGTVFRCSGRDDDVIRQIRALSPADAEQYPRFARAVEQILDAAFPLIDQPFTRIGRMLRVVPDLVRVRAWRSVASLVNGYFSDPRVRQVFSFHPLLIGGHPFESPAIYALIHALEKRWGVWFAAGGTGALVRALADGFVSRGGELRLATAADEIVIDDRSRRASGLRLSDGSFLAADAVVSNADVTETYLRLVAPRHRRVNTDRRLTRRRHGMSLVVIYFGTDVRYEHMGHHEILMGPRYRGLLDDVFRRGVLADDFSLYLHRPTATDPTLAPPGCDAWYVLSPVPHLGASIDWEREGARYRDAIMRYLEERYLPDLSRHIVTERRIDPRYFRDELGSHLGNAFAVEPLLRQSAWLRPHNVSEDVPNLYFAGAGTHPGAGLPGVLSSGKIVADLIGPSSGNRGDFSEQPAGRGAEDRE